MILTRKELKEMIRLNVLPSHLRETFEEAKSVMSLMKKDIYSQLRKSNRIEAG